MKIATIFSILASLLVAASAGLPTVTHKVYFEISVDGKPIGRMVFGLFGDTVPKTVANFCGLATRGIGAGYRKSIFHRVIPGFMVSISASHSICSILSLGPYSSFFVPFSLSRPTLSL